MHIILILTIAVTLSMDAFSLSLVYGTLNFSKHNIVKLSLIVGIYHFVMPLLGLTLGNIIQNYTKINANVIIFIVFLVIGIQMIIESRKKTNVEPCTSLVEMLLFGLAVSIDSFSVGIGLKAITNKALLVPLIFSFTSGIFTFLGLHFGKKINSLIGKLSTFIGGIILIALSLLYLFNVL